MSRLCTTPVSALYPHTHTFTPMMLVFILKKVSICAVLCFIISFFYSKPEKKKKKEANDEETGEESPRDWWYLCVWQVVIRRNDCSPHTEQCFYQPAGQTRHNTQLPSASLSVPASFSFISVSSCAITLLSPPASYLYANPIISAPSPPIYLPLIVRLAPLSFLPSPVFPLSLASSQIDGINPWLALSWPVRVTVVKCSQCTHTPRTLTRTEARYWLQVASRMCLRDFNITSHVTGTDDNNIGTFPKAKRTIQNRLSSNKHLAVSYVHWKQSHEVAGRDGGGVKRSLFNGWVQNLLILLPLAAPSPSGG